MKAKKTMFCYICNKRCFKKWIGQTKDKKYHWLCRVDGLIVGQPKTQENMAIWPLDNEIISPIKAAEDLGYQVTMEEG